MSSTSNNAAVTGNDAVDDVMATSQSAENGTSHDTADGEIKNDVGGHGKRAVLEDDAGNIDADGAERLGVLPRLAREGDCGG